MYAPLLMSAIQSDERDGFSSADLAQLLSAHLSGQVPDDVVGIIANRCVRRGYLRRDAGRWLPTGKTPPVGANKDAIHAEWNHFLSCFVEYSKSKGCNLSDNDAEETLLSIIKENRVGLVLFDALDNTSNAKKIASSLEVLVAGKFFADCVSRDQRLQNAVAAIVSGLVLRSTIFIGDSIASLKRMNKLTVFLDSKLAFAMLGIGSEQECRAVQQGILLLRRNGAALRVYDKTIDEMKRVLTVYKERLGTVQGIRTLYHTSLTTYFLKAKATPADVAVLMVSLERKLRDYEVLVVDTPDRIPAFTLDEKALESILSTKDSADFSQIERRVVHDVDCVAAVLTMRKGRHRNRVEDSGFVFSTLSWMTAKNIGEWYRSQGESGASPCVHQSVLTVLSWLNNPSAGDEWVRAGVGSIAVFASTVSDRAWEKFKRYLQRLVESSEISTDEELMLLASTLSESAIVDEAIARGDSPDDPDVTTISEAVERVRKLESARLNETSAELMAARTDNALRQSKRIIFARKAGAFFSWIVFSLLIFISIGGLFFSLPDEGSLMEMITPMLSGLIGLAALIFGADVKGWRNDLVNWVAEKVLQILP